MDNVCLISEDPDPIHDGLKRNINVQNFPNGKLKKRTKCQNSGIFAIHLIKLPRLFFLINIMKGLVMTKVLITKLNVEVSTNILCDKAVWAAKFKLC